MEKLVITDMAGQPFLWRRGKYIEKGGYLIPSGRAYKYRPDFERICEVLAGLPEKELGWFFNEFGPLGTWAYFLKTGAHESYMRFEEPREEVARLKWDRLFGLVDRLAFERDDENSFWRAYREPLWLTRLALTELQHTVNAALAGEHHHAARVQFEMVGGQLICRVTSLLEGAIATLLWNITHGKIFRECAGRKRYGCVSCRYHKVFFWPSNKKHIIGYPSCKIYQAARGERYRGGKTKKMPQRSWKKRDEALALHQQGVSTVKIAEKLGVKMEIVVKWLMKEVEKRVPRCETKISKN
ncbi:MAG: hypothetical protein IMW94_08770 [Thermoanaerobacter sp.]|nr:hypothetical protein [Thermoanaerobacter sp.]